MRSTLPAYYIACVILLCPISVWCCTEETFHGTQLIAIKNVALGGELTDYNFFSKVHSGNLASVRHITGCITPIDELEDVVAIQIRGEKVPILYNGAVQNLPFLHSLHIVSSEVNIIKPQAFQNLPWLTVIKIQDNNIEVIHSNVFNGLMVKKLILSFNNISYVNPEAFNDMPRLESVNLEGNKLTVWDVEWFRNSPHVEFLSVKFNLLKSLPPRAFRNIQDELQRLYLSHNDIKDIAARAFVGLKKLTDLSLAKNNLTVLDDSTFLYLENLKMIDLSETSITCFSETLLNTLRSDALLWIDNIPLNFTCKETVEKWAVDNDNHLTLFKTLKNVATNKPDVYVAT